MGAPQPTDSELLLVAQVARREGWRDLASPPAGHSGSRTLGEAAAVARYAAAARARAVAKRSARLRMRILLILLAVVVLAAAWYVSPERTALGLIGGGIFCFITLRRKKRKRERKPRAAASRG